MNATHLLKFIKNKFKNYPNEVVYQDQNSTLTLANIAHNFNFDYRKLNLDLLDVQAD